MDSRKLILVACLIFLCSCQFEFNAHKTDELKTEDLAPIFLKDGKVAVFPEKTSIATEQSASELCREQTGDAAPIIKALGSKDYRGAIEFDCKYLTGLEAYSSTISRLPKSDREIDQITDINELKNVQLLNQAILDQASLTQAFSQVTRNQIQRIDDRIKALEAK